VTARRAGSAASLVASPAVSSVIEVLAGIAVVVTSILAVVLVLLHSGKGGGLSDMFGGAGTTALGSTAAERNLNRITVVVVTIWAFSIVGLGLLID
jgi:preprotein translocase subunit SecG